jgi:hypothetical protein
MKGNLARLKHTQMINIRVEKCSLIKLIVFVLKKKDLTRAVKFLVLNIGRVEAGDT